MALIASIGLNVFLIGAAITVFAIRSQSSRPIGAQRATLRAASSSLTQPYQSAFAKLLRDEGKAIQGDNRLSRHIRDEAWASLSSAAFDPATAKAQLARARVINLATHRKVEDAVVDFATTLPAAERAAFAQAMRRTVPRQRVDSAPATGNGS
jgi:uncharacterized membrane protein